MALELQGVAVDALSRPGEAGPDVVQALLEPAAPTLENAQPGVGVGATEEGEVNAEALVLPGGRAGLGEQVAEPLLALGGELVDDPGTASGKGGGSAGVGRGLGDPAALLQVLQARVASRRRRRGNFRARC